MAYIHANGDEEQRPRTPEEIAAIEEVNRIAAKSCWRQVARRKGTHCRCEHYHSEEFHPDMKITMPVTVVAEDCYIHTKGIDRRQHQQRQILSTFERDMLLQGGVNA